MNDINAEFEKIMHLYHSWCIVAAVKFFYYETPENSNAKRIFPIYLM